MAKHEIALGTVQETLLIPLYGRSVENGKDRPILRDPSAEALVASLAHDFTRFDELPSLTGTVLRTALFDRWVSDFSPRTPQGGWWSSA